jgi:cellulose synthase operon protein YhjQ
MGLNGNRIDTQSTTDSTPEDVAALYAWANLRGAKYRDYSASRREHRAQVRYRAAKSLLDREMKAQADAEASAETAERQAREAEARALARTVTQPQQSRLAALHTAEAATIKAAADRVEAARRAEAAAHATVLALREERELAEAHASATQQEMIYTESEALRKHLAGPQPRLLLGDTAPSAEPVAVATAELPALPPFEQLEAAHQAVEATPHASKAASWQPLSEAILGPGQDWNTLRSIHASASTSAAVEEQPRPAWLAVPPSPTSEVEPPPDIEPPPEIEPPFEVEPSPAVSEIAPAEGSEAATASETTTPEIPQPPSRPESVPRWLALRQVYETSARENTDSTSARTPEIRTPLLAVFSLAGGVGATSVVASLGRALSAAGEKPILIDTTSQALLPFYFGGKELRAGLMRTWSPPEGTGEPVSLILHDASQMNRDETAQQRLTQQIFSSAIGAQRILVDLSPPSSWLLRRWVDLRPAVLVPLVPSMDSVIRLEATEKLFAAIRGKDGSSLLPYYVLNHFDASLPLHLDIRSVLRRRLGDRLLRFTIRSSPAIAEAVADGMTILDYAPEAGVAQEYRDIAAWLANISPPRSIDVADSRWSHL